MSSPEPLLASLDPIVAWLADWSVEQVEGAGRWLGAALGLVVLVLLAARLRRPATRRGPALLAGACALGWVAQSLLLAGAWLPGIGCLAVASALCVFVWIPGPWGPGSLAARAPRLGIESLAWLGLAVVFAGASLYRIDVRPEPNLDERAYFNAARMQVGDRERGPVTRVFGTVIYDFSRFQAQVLPHAAQSAALALFGNRITSARLASLLCSGAALLGLAACVRRHWGPRAALLTLGAGATAPLWLIHAQRAYYIAATELHAVVCFALLLRFERLRTPAAGALLGALLGASVCFYQLSWFVPLLCALCLLASPSPRRWRAAPVAALVATALLVALPAAWLARDGLRQVYSQSVDKLPPTLRAAGHTAEPTVASASLLAREIESEAVAVQAERYREQGLFVQPASFGRRFAWLGLAGPSGAVERAVAELGAERWVVVGGSQSESLLARPLDMWAQLFVGPAHEQHDSWVAGPVLVPWVAPLLLLGIAVAWRRRDDVLARFLALWVAAASVVPALVAGPLPRRAVLMLPFGFALVARVVLEATRSATGPRAWGRAATLAQLAFVLLMLGAGVGAYYGTWVAATPLEPEPPPPLLVLEDVVRGLPAERTFLVTSLLRAPRELLRGLQPAGIAEPGLVRAPGAPTAEGIRRESCRRDPPFVWLTLDSPDQRSAFEQLAAGHEIERFSNSGLLAVRVTGRTQEACAPARAHRRL